MIRYEVVPTPVEQILPGDTVEVDGVLRSVCKNDLKRGFMGVTLFGDSYKAGTVPVSRVVTVRERTSD